MKIDKNILDKFEQNLELCIPNNNCYEKKVIDSMKYSLMLGGKRIRPMLVFYFSLLCGGSIDKAMSFACAIEMIHTYSLIHDDLPCMDNDDLRRGKPSNHKVFGEDVALLAGDALQSLAFSTIANKKNIDLLGCEAVSKAVAILAKRCGANGMVGGQMIDIENINNNISLELLNILNDKKTGDLLACACELGCVSANASDEKIALAEQFGRYIGLAFQIRDDILDITSDEKTLGKPTGSDKSNKKQTYPEILGIEKAEEAINNYTEKALLILNKFDGDTKNLRDFVLYLQTRSY